MKMKWDTYNLHQFDDEQGTKAETGALAKDFGGKACPANFEELDRLASQVLQRSSQAKETGGTMKSTLGFISKSGSAVLDCTHEPLYLPMKGELCSFLKSLQCRTGGKLRSNMNDVRRNFEELDRVLRERKLMVEHMLKRDRQYNVKEYEKPDEDLLISRSKEFTGDFTHALNTGVRPGQRRRWSRQEEEERELTVIKAAEEFLNKGIKDNLSLYDCLLEGQLGSQPTLSSLHTCDNQQIMAIQDCKVSILDLSSGSQGVLGALDLSDLHGEIYIGSEHVRVAGRANKEQWQQSNCPPIITWEPYNHPVDVGQSVRSAWGFDSNYSLPLERLGNFVQPAQGGGECLKHSRQSSDPEVETSAIWKSRNSWRPAMGRASTDGHRLARTKSLAVSRMSIALKSKSCTSTQLMDTPCRCRSCSMSPIQTRPSRVHCLKKFCQSAVARLEGGLRDGTRKGQSGLRHLEEARRSVDAINNLITLPECSTRLCTSLMQEVGGGEHQTMISRQPQWLHWDHHQMPSQRTSISALATNEKSQSVFAEETSETITEFANLSEDGAPIQTSPFGLTKQSVLSRTKLYTRGGRQHTGLCLATRPQHTIGAVRGFKDKDCCCRSQAKRKCNRKLPKCRAASAPQSRHLDTPAILIGNMVVKQLEGMELGNDGDLHASKTIADNSSLLTEDQSNDSYLMAGSRSMGKLPEMVQATRCSLNHSHAPKDLLGENFDIVKMPQRHCGSKEEVSLSSAMSSSDALRNDVGRPCSTANVTCLTTVDDPNLRCQIDGDILHVNECRSSFLAWPELDSLILQVINDWLDRSNTCLTTRLQQKIKDVTLTSPIEVLTRESSVESATGTEGISSQCSERGIEPVRVLQCSKPATYEGPEDMPNAFWGMKSRSLDNWERILESSDVKGSICEANNVAALTSLLQPLTKPLEGTQD